jgi:phosphatidylglycerophosphate synthase
MLRQDRVFDRAEEGRMNAHRAQRGEQQRDVVQQQPGRAEDHDQDLGGLHDPDDARLVVSVGELAGERREQEEWQDEQPAGNRDAVAAQPPDTVANPRGADPRLPLWRPTPIDYLITFVLYCLVGITDYFDGYLARAQGQISKLGQFLDPIADKIMVAAVIVMLVASRQADGDPPIIEDLHIIPALIILLREIIVSGFANSSPSFGYRCRSATSPSGRRPSSWSRSER